MITDIYSIKPGDKIKFCGTKMFWFTDMIENAEKNLKIGNVYEVSYVRINSSWVKIKLKETGDLDYSLSWFDNP